MKEEAGHLENGLPIALVDDEEREIHLIVPAGWTVIAMAGNSGCHLEITKSVSVPPTSKAVSLREIKCEQKEPTPTLERIPR